MGPLEESMKKVFHHTPIGKLLHANDLSCLKSRTPKVPNFFQNDEHPPKLARPNLAKCNNNTRYMITSLHV